METLIKVVWYLVVGGLLLLANIWFIRSLKSFQGGGDIVIAPLHVIGREDKDEKLGLTLAQLLQARLGKIRSDLETSQRSLAGSSSARDVNRKPPRPIWGLPSQILEQRRVDLHTQLLDPIDIDVAVGGVKVGGLFSWLQRALSQTRTLDFAVYVDGDKAVVAGDMTPLTHAPGTLWAPVEKATPEEIVSTIAYSLVHARLAQDPSNRLEALSLREFRTLLNTIFETARLNRLVALGRPAREGFAALLPGLEDLSARVPDWYEMLYLTASVADSAEDKATALRYYQQLQQLAAKKGPQALQVDPAVQSEVEKRVGELTGGSEKGPAVDEALAKIRDDAAYAVAYLNELFSSSRQVPGIVLEPADFHNAYWKPDDETYHAPPQVKDLPDVTYHEVSQPFIASVAPLIFDGQSGSIVQSYADILATLTKQRRLGQSAAEADWTIAPGAVAWLTGKDVASAPDRSPLRSLKSPGSAYHGVPLLGDDPQVASFDRLVTTAADSGGVFINAGIPNKAFYETASRIGTDKAGQIWLQALHRLPENSDFQTLATETFDAAAVRFGEDSAEQKAVGKAWEIVKVPRKPENE